MKKSLLLLLLISILSIHARTFDQYIMECERTIKQGKYQKTAKLMSQNILSVLSEKETAINKIIDAITSMDQAARATVHRPNKELKELSNLTDKVTKLIQPVKAFIIKQNRAILPDYQAFVQGKTKETLQALLKKHKMHKVWEAKAYIFPEYEKVLALYNRIQNRIFLAVAESNVW